VYSFYGLEEVQKTAAESGSTMDNPPTGRTVELILNAALGEPMSTAMYEGLCAGSDGDPVLSVAVCYAPTLEILRRAASEHKTMIVSREHPFYLHGGLNYGYTTGGLEAALHGDPVVAAKREVITSNHLMVYRFASGWDRFRPQGQSAALAKAMGLTPIPAAPGDLMRGVVCNLPKTSLVALAQTAVDRLKSGSPRVVGNMNAGVTRVAVLAGETDPRQTLAKIISDPKVDGVIVGAGGMVDEVDGAISYFRDVIATGRKIALLAVGYGPSEEPGVQEMARWMQTALPDLSVEWWPAHDPSWIPRG
jgi:putative NIF3 family GTP cyclohydrolase 1 type 2